MLTTLRDRDIDIVERWVEKGLFVEEGFDGKMDWEIGMGVVDGKGTGVGDVDGRGVARSKL